jgi:hypothetical protein
MTDARLTLMFGLQWLNPTSYCSLADFHIICHQQHTEALIDDDTSDF